MLNRMNNNRIKNALIACLTARKKTLVQALTVAFAVAIAVPLVAFSAQPLTAKAVGPNMVEILVKVNREVVKTPNLYEHLTLTLSTAENPAGLGAVEVLNKKMSLLGNEPISIGKYSGPDLYIFFKVTFDGPESTNEYQGARVLTSYEFFSQSARKLNAFKILSKYGDVFKDMTNLNPGDVKEGVVHIDPLSFTLIEGAVDEQTTGQLPVTDDPTPIKPLIYISAGLAVFLLVQIAVYVKTKRKDKADEIGSQA